MMEKQATSRSISRVDRPSVPKKSIDNSTYIHKSGYMELEDAILALAALAQPTRLDVFRLLVKHEPDGLAAGGVAKALAVPPNTMSSHLSILSRAGPVPAHVVPPPDFQRLHLPPLQAAHP